MFKSGIEDKYEYAEFQVVEDFSIDETTIDRATKQARLRRF